MTLSQQNRRKIDAYLRRELFSEACYAQAYEMDVYTRAVYRRVRELYWTISRFVRKHLPSSGKTPAEVFPQASPELRLALQSASPRIFIDTTNLISTGRATGIQRVVKETGRHAAAAGLALPVSIRADSLAPAMRDAGLGDVIIPREGDILLLLDAGWNHAEDYPPALSAFREKGGRVVACLYDLFPALYPGLYQQVLVADFKLWLEDVVTQSDAVVAISRSTAESYLDHARRADVKPATGQRVGWWRLGADLVDGTVSEASDKTRAIVARGAFFLSVGTIEMRKAYGVALAAFEQLWAEGVDARFVIVGRSGWNAASFEERLRTHPENGRRLFWLDDAGDADLAFLYRGTRGVVLSTFAEGFGLPLVEAANFGAPVIASDIDVFQEIGGANVRYFQLLDPLDLAARLKEALISDRVSPDIAALSWRDSSEALMQMLRNETYQTRVG